MSITIVEADSDTVEQLVKMDKDETYFIETWPVFLG